MKNKFFTLCIAFITLLAQTPVAFAQESIGASREWTAVQAVSTGDELIVETKDGVIAKGKLSSVNDAQLTLSRGGSRVTNVAQNNVRKVYRMQGRSRGKSALIGAGIGGASGVGLGGVLYAQDTDDMVGVIVPIFGILGAGIGAGIGAVFGGKRKRVLIYEAK